MRSSQSLMTLMIANNQWIARRSTKTVYRSFEVSSSVEVETSKDNKVRMKAFLDPLTYQESLKALTNRFIICHS